MRQAFANAQDRAAAEFARLSGVTVDGGVNAPASGLPGGVTSTPPGFVAGKVRREEANPRWLCLILTLLPIAAGLIAALGIAGDSPTIRFFLERF